MKIPLKSLTTYSVLASITAMLQIVGGYLPGFGQMISGFSTLFVAMAGYMRFSGGILVFWTSALLIGILMPTELPIFMLGNGLLGLMLGWTFRLGQVTAAFFSGTVFAVGMFSMAYLLGLPLMGPAKNYFTGSTAFFIITVFSWFFSYLWTIVLKRVLHKMSHVFKQSF